MSCIHVRKDGRFAHVFIIFILHIFWPTSFISHNFCPVEQMYMHIIHVGGSKEVLSLVKLSETDRNNLVPLTGTLSTQSD